MAKSPTWLLEHQGNVFSQHGEDGIIETVLAHLPIRNYWCAEIGAWDGEHLSNTRNLIKHHNHFAVLIEGDRKRGRKLQTLYEVNTKVWTFNRYVTLDGNSTLEGIFEKTPIPKDFDFLSIDIDGGDYHLWDSLYAYEPKVVCIEFNDTIPTQVHFVQPKDLSVNQGSSLTAMVELGKQKGYELISVLPGNAFFVREDFFSSYGITQNDPTILRTTDSRITYLFTGYDGTVFIDGNQIHTWNRIPIHADRLQLIPKFLRKYSGSLSPKQKIVYGLLWDLWTLSNPFKRIQRLRRQMRRIQLSQKE